MSAPCPECGFDAPSLSPLDAIVALRSLGRRFAALVPPPDPDSGGEGINDEDRRLVMAEAGRAAADIDAIGTDLRRVLVSDRPVVHTSGDLGAEGQGDVDSLRAAADSVADLAAAQPASAWARVGLRDGAPVSAADLLREAVHAGVHRLRAAQRALAQR